MNAQSLFILFAAAIGGVAGCLGLWLVLNRIAGLPFAKLGGHPGKQLWSVLFMMPVPFMLSLGPLALTLPLSLAWLALAPTVATKYWFGPATAKWGKTAGFNAIYGVIALAVYFAVTRLF